MSKRYFSIFSRILCAFIVLLVGLMTPESTQAATRIDIVGPAGSGLFGFQLTVLTNGNFVIHDPQYSPIDGPTRIGAVYLYDGDTLDLISTLTGTQANDEISSGGVYALPNGNFVVSNPGWKNGSVEAAGAVILCSGVTGCTGQISATNSLVGTQAGDLVGTGGVVPLVDGDYVVHSSMWINGTVDAAGAVTWCSGTTGCQGPVSVTNSIVGTETGQFGRSIDHVLALPNGSFVVRSPDWDNGTVANAGAVRWCNGLSPCTGPLNESNSLIGTHDQDLIGFAGGYDEFVILPNGNYVVSSPEWDDGPVADVGAVTWCSGTTGCVGPVTPFNSVVGTVGNDLVGWYGIKVLTNGNYVVWDTSLHNGALIYAGGVRLCSGGGGCVGAMTPANSLVGTHDYDGVGLVVPLTNGNYVVRSARWDGPIVPNVGAVTWCSGTSGCIGPVTETNSVVGSHGDDDYGDGGPYYLTNGNYVILYPYWDNGSIVDAGAARWCSGEGGCTGPITAANSLVGTTASEGVGMPGFTKLANGNYVLSERGTLWCSGTSGCTGAASSYPLRPDGQAYALSDGNYVVSNPTWTNGGAASAGAVTWCSGSTGCEAVTSTANSLVGSTASDGIGDQVTALPAGSYVVSSPYWDNGGITDSGAVTWCPGGGTCIGVVSPTNSLVGSLTDDHVGKDGVYILPDHGYVVISTDWDNGGMSDSGAVTWVNGQDESMVGPITAINSVLGETTGMGMSMDYVYDQRHLRLFVKHFFDNKVTLLQLPILKVYFPLLKR
jgi:hypothetical protein